jgi:hypothetical protein
MTFLQKAREFRDLIWLKIEVKLKKLKVWKSIENEIKNIQDQGSSWKHVKLIGSF